MQVLFLAVSAAAAVGGTENPTFNRDVAPIVFEHCANCHRPGAIAPMSLMSYAEARPWAKAMRQAVHDRVMPPWDADPKVGKFSNDISLKPEQIETIVSWVDGGAPEGDAKDLPAAPVFPEGWLHGTPDYVVDLPAFEVPAAGPDRFPNVIVSLDLPQDAYLSAVEFRPGEPRVMHHLVLFHGYLAMSNDVIDQRTNKSSGGMNPFNTPNVMHVYAAGSPPGVFPAGMGHKLKANDTLSLNGHYHPYGEAATDKSKLGLYFSKEPLTKFLTTATAVNPALRIPPNSTEYSQRTFFTFTQDSQIVSYLPHMHVRGKGIRYLLHTPDGATADLLNVPSYDYNWQWIYYPETPVKAPAGSMLEVIGQWDNSTANKLNPDPTKTVRFGEGTNDEMLVGFAEYVPDEGELPRPAPPMQRVTRALAQHPAQYSYLAPGGFLPLALYLPKTGDGTMYISVGEIMLAATLYDLTWRGNTAIMNTRILTSNADSAPLSLRAAIDGDTITGAVFLGRELKPEDLDAATLPGGREFTGTRVATKTAKAGQ